MKKVCSLAALSLLMACQQNSTSPDVKDAGPVESHKHHHHTHVEVKLNNGERWKANKETTEGIENMQKLISEFNPEQKSYEGLQLELQEEFRLIFKRCTMKGESHDQLHNYLIPLKEKLEKVEASSLDEIEAYLKTYKNYFV